MRTYGKLERPNAWLLTAEPHIILRAKRVFAGSSKQYSGQLTITDSIDNARDLEWFRERYPIEISADNAVYLKRRADAHREKESVVSRMLAGTLEARPFNLAIPAREYQRAAAEMWLRVGGLLCADDLGLGKTCVGIAGLTDPNTRPALVVTKVHLLRQWQRELKKFAPQLTTHVIKGTKPYDISERARFRRDPSQLELGVPMGGMPDVCITAYSRLAGWAETLPMLFKSVIYDEVQELRKGERSDKGKAAFAISRAVLYRLGLTATPIYNYGGEIWSVCEALSPGTLGTWQEFATEHLEGDDKDKATLKDPKAFSFYMRESGIMLRRTRAEVGRELPPLTKVLHQVEADDRPLKEAQTQAERLAEIILAKHEENRGDRLLASGELDKLVRRATGVAKAPYVAEFVRILVENGESVMLYGWHRDVYAIWLERLADLNPVMYTGSESPKQKDDAVRAFVGDPENGIAPRTKLFIISLRSGEGLDGCQKVCTTTVFGEFDWSPMVHEQCTGRPHRDGQTLPCTAYYLWTDEGSDPVVMDVLGLKLEQAEGIRNPTADAIERIEANPERIRDLARQYLKRPRATPAPETQPHV